jgi:hypothetical protein
MIAIPAAPAITSLTSAQQAVAVGEAYSVTLTGINGISPYKSWALASGSGPLPSCLSLSSSGVLSSTSTPTASCVGVYTGIVFTMTDSGTAKTLAATSSAQTITVYSALSLPTPNPASLPSIAYVGIPYNNGSGGAITGTGGSGNLSIAVSGSGLPADGLSATSNGGVLTVKGTPAPSATLPYTVTFGLTLTDNTTKNSITQTGYSVTVNNPTAVSLPATNPSSLGSAINGQTYTGTINVSGGVPPYTWSIGNTQIGSSCYSLGNGSMCATSTGGNTLSITGTPSATGTVTLTNVRVVDSANSSATQNYTITVNATEPITINLNQVPQGMVTMPFTFSALNISGGTSPYTVTYTNVPAGLSQQSGTWNLTGTPTSSATTTVKVTVADSAPSQNSTSTTFNLVMAPQTTGINNGQLKGQYACYYQQSWDGGVLGGDSKSTLYRGGSVFAFTADGKGNITGGELDSNSPNSGYKSSTTNGALSGTYAVGTNNRGYALISAANQSGPVVLELAAGKLDSNGYFSELALMSMDDVGTIPSGKWGSGVCYQQTATGLSGITPSGGYASVLRGEDGSGNLTATAEFLQFSGGATSGVYDTVDNAVLSANLTSAANTYTKTDSYGRMVLTSTVSPFNSQVWYITNSSGTAVRMSANPHNASSDAGFSIGEARAQVSSAVSTGYPINGKVVMYLSGLNSSLSAYKAAVMQADATGNSGSTTIMVNADLSNEGGSLNTSGQDVGQPMTYTADTTTGRTTFSLGGQPRTGEVLYAYGPNSAAVLFGDGSPAQALVGWLEPQTAPTSGTWSTSDLSTSFFMHKVNTGDPKLSPNNSSLTIGGSGSFTNYLEDEGGQQWADWGDGLCGCSGYSGALVPDTAVDTSTGTLGLDPNGTIGIFDTQLTLIGTTETVAWCVAVSVDTATNPSAEGRLVCLDRLTNHPSVNIGQQ